MTGYDINNFDDFCVALADAGFTIGGGKNEGVFSLVGFTWTESPPGGSKLCWHTGDRDTDPWKWRLRVLDERDDIAYAKMFFRKGGYVTREWYPYFLAVRRGGASFEEMYYDGLISREAKRIYEVIAAHNALPVQDIKRLGGFSREEKSRFDAALIELQMRMFVTMCGHSRSVGRDGEEYGWEAMLYCTSEAFFGAQVFAEAEELDYDKAYSSIREQVLRMNPDAYEKKTDKFIRGI